MLHSGVELRIISLAVTTREGGWSSIPEMAVVTGDALADQMPRRRDNDTGEASHAACWSPGHDESIEGTVTYFYQPTGLQLDLNLKTAKALGIEFRPLCWPGRTG